MFIYIRNTKLRNSQSNVFIKKLLINLFHKSISILGTELGEGVQKCIMDY